MIKTYILREPIKIARENLLSDLRNGKYIIQVSITIKMYIHPTLNCTVSAGYRPSVSLISFAILDGDDKSTFNGLWRKWWWQGMMIVKMMTVMLMTGYDDDCMMLTGYDVDWVWCWLYDVDWKWWWLYDDDCTDMTGYDAYNIKITKYVLRGVWVKLE